MRATIFVSVLAVCLLVPSLGTAFDHSSPESCMAAMDYIYQAENIIRQSGGSDIDRSLNNLRRKYNDRLAGLISSLRSLVDNWETNYKKCRKDGSKEACREAKYCKEQIHFFCKK